MQKNPMTFRPFAFPRCGSGSSNPAVATHIGWYSLNSPSLLGFHQSAPLDPTASSQPEVAGEDEFGKGLRMSNAPSDLVVCFISREGTPAMNDMISQSLVRLGKRGYRIVGVHLEEREASLSRSVREVCDLSIIKPSPRGLNPFANARRVSELLLGGLRDIVTEVFRGGARAVVYMEGDKFTFVPYVDALAAPILERGADVSLAVRSPEGFCEFPWIQRFVERGVNRYLSRYTGIGTDYLYGPRAFSPRTASFFRDYRDDDWGLMMYPVLASIVQDYRFESVVVPGAPQPNYMAKYDPIMRPPPAHLVWRSVQNLAIMRSARAAALLAKRSG
jgi:hypothetical protein